MKKYFVSSKETESSCYYEFYKGKWDEETFWKDDSIYIKDDDLDDCNFFDILTKHVPDFAPFGETEIACQQWEMVKAEALAEGGKNAEIVMEADEWIQDTFSKYEVFTILGI